MLLIPSIELKDGKCARLRRDKRTAGAVFSDDPQTMAEHWIAQGARRLQLVDLDGAARGEPINADLVHDIAAAYPDIPIQVGGGIRDEASVEVYIQAGVRYVIIDTRAINEPHLISDLCAEFSTHVIVGLDAKEGRVATEGWSKLSRHDAVDMARHFQQHRVEAIIYTDLARDGTLQGVNIEATVKLAEAIDIPVIAAGGIHNLETIKQLAQVAASGIIGVISSRAIYAGTLDFAAGQQLADAIAGQQVFGL